MIKGEGGGRKEKKWKEKGEGVTYLHRRRKDDEGLYDAIGGAGGCAVEGDAIMVWEKGGVRVEKWEVKISLRILLYFY